VGELVGVELGVDIELEPNVAPVVLLLKLPVLL
jgi:hypothetical protein